MDGFAKIGVLRFERGLLAATFPPLARRNIARLIRRQRQFLKVQGSARIARGFGLFISKAPAWAINHRVTSDQTPTCKDAAVGVAILQRFKMRAPIQI